MPLANTSWQAATQRIRAQIEWLKANHAADPGSALQHLTELRNHLQSTGDLVLQMKSGSAAIGDEASLADYCDSLRRLQEVLPMLQSQLLAQRARLEPEQAHVQAAADWLNCNAKTR